MQIKTWQERAAELPSYPTPEQAYQLLQGEIDELRAALAATPAPTAPSDVSYEIVQDDMVVAGASGPAAEREIRHYASQYEQDGPIEIFKITRTPLR